MRTIQPGGGEMKAITISHHYGSVGGEVGARLTERLNWHLIDHEMVEALAAEIVAEIGDPSHTCGCTLFYRNSVGENICHQCLPRPQKYAPGMLTDEQWRYCPSRWWIMRTSFPLA